MEAGSPQTYQSDHDHRLDMSSRGRYLLRLWLGRLPGDIAIRGEHGGFYFPIVTCLLISLILSAIFWLIGRF